MNFAFGVNTWLLMTSTVVVPEAGTLVRSVLESTVVLIVSVPVADGVRPLKDHA